MKKKKLNIRKRITNYMEDVTIDVFGIEKKVHENVKDYMEEMAKKYRVPVKHLNVRISQPDQELEADVYHFDQRIKSTSYQELANFFLGEGVSEILDLEKKIKESIAKYLTTYAIEHAVSRPLLVVRIDLRGDQAQAKAYDRSELLNVIPIKHLIKHFNA